ncbi:MAG: metallophosphoesterase, partial [Acidobacteria bacterium]|nr:metallophosphoesterase [Acidobacteriota bacterium]
MPVRKFCALLVLALGFVSWDPASAWYWSHDSTHAQAASRDSRIVAIADVHGDIDAFRGILKAAGLINDAGRWAGRKATLVQTGDILDRGAHVRAVMDLLMTLEGQARAAGGRVEALFGNHEGMNLLGEMRDVNPAAFAAFAGARSERRQADAYEEYARISAARTKALGSSVAPYDQDRPTWMAAHPRGYLEYRDALGPGGRYGRWLRSRNAVAQIGDTIFLHGGISPEAATQSIKALNDRVRSEIRTFDESVKALAAADLVRPSFTLQEILQVVSLEANALKGVEELTETQARIIPALRGLIPINESWLLDSNGPLWFRGY